MKYTCYLLLAVALTGQACKQKRAAREATTLPEPALPATTKDKNGKPPEFKVEGVYTADFSGSPIYITINYTNGQSVAGFNLHKGLRRNLQGRLAADGDKWTVVLDEPGDHAFDGVFQLKFNHDFTKGSGTWKPKNNQQLSTKTLELTRVESREDGMHYAYVADNRDLTFDTDGSCEYSWYDMRADSSIVDQVNVLMGSWEKKGDTVLITWEKEGLFGKKVSRWGIRRFRDTTNGGNWESSEINADSILFTPAFD